METDQITIKAFMFLVYGYVSISTFVLIAISKLTENLEKALDFDPIVSQIVFINMIVFISFLIYKAIYISKKDQYRIQPK